MFPRYMHHNQKERKLNEQGKETTNVFINHIIQISYSRNILSYFKEFQQTIKTLPVRTHSKKGTSLVTV